MPSQVVEFSIKYTFLFVFYYFIKTPLLLQLFEICANIGLLVLFF